MKRATGILSTAGMVPRIFLTLILLLVFVGTGFARSRGNGAVPPLNLDHYYCYVAVGEPTPIAVLLQDQFDLALNQTETVQDLRIVRFCNPVQKTTADGTVTSIQHPDDHLTMYVITPEPAIPRVVFIRNQFGTQPLRTGAAVVLGVPSGKIFPVPTPGSGPPPSVPPIPTDIDHFKCYLASGKPVDRTVLLMDQFLQTTTAPLFTGVLQPVLFCNPVQKTVRDPSGGSTTTKITNPAAHLACYVTTRRAFQGTLLYDNQFSPQLTPLSVFNPDFLCVPSVKLRWAEIPVPTSFAPPNDEGGDDQGDD